MNKEEEKTSLRPLTSALVDPEKYSFNKVYFDKFDLITKERNEKEEKEKIKKIYKERNINKKYHIFSKKCIDNPDHIICNKIKEKCEYINNFFIFKKIKLKKIKLKNPDPLDKTKINDELISIDSYFEKLINELSFKSANNIAITGPYGSGKSSIIETYLAYNSKLDNDIIRISLTNFSYSQSLINLNKEVNNEKNEEETIPGQNQGKCNILKINVNDNPDSNTKNSEKNKENAIEEEIISELIYQIDPKNIYLSKYKAKKNIKLKPWLWCIFSFILFLIYLCLIIYFAIKCNKDFFCESDFWKNALIFSPLILPIFPAIYISIKYKSQITKIRFFNQVDTELNQDKCGLSKFDKEYRELVYILKNSKKRIIIFEDLDRLENLEFLTKLRKINYILNRDKSQRFKFIFVMNDDRFIRADEKTKFFDLIIPVVPFKNTSNINKIFKSLLSKYFYSNDILYEVSEYINDNRLAINISNEFLIYYEKIKENFVSEDSLKLNSGNLFISIVLKNIFPKSFNYILSLKNEKINFNELENKENLSKEINGEYKKLFNLIKDKFNDITYEEFYTYISDYFVSKTDRDWLIFLNGNKDAKFVENKHNFEINDLTYIIRFLNIKNLMTNKSIYWVIKNIDFVKQIFLKLTRKENNLSKKENQLIFNYFLKDFDSLNLTLRKFLKKYSESYQFSLRTLIIFFNIIIEKNHSYKDYIFDFFVSLRKYDSNLFQIKSMSVEINSILSEINLGPPNNIRPTLVKINSILSEINSMLSVILYPPNNIRHTLVKINSILSEINLDPPNNIENIKYVLSELDNMLSEIINSMSPKTKSLQKEYPANIDIIMKISFLCSLIFNTKNDGLKLFDQMDDVEEKCFFYDCSCDNFIGITNKEIEFLLFLNTNPSNQQKLIINDKFLKFANYLYEKDYMKNLIHFVYDNNLFIFEEIRGDNNIHTYFEKQKLFLGFFDILDDRKGKLSFNFYGEILSNFRKYENLYNSYFNFVIDNFIYFLADVINKSKSFNFYISEDEDIILKILNSDKLMNKHKEIYISYINKETLNKIDSNEIENKEIRDFFDHTKKTKNKFSNSLS